MSIHLLSTQITPKSQRTRMTHFVKGMRSLCQRVFFVVVLSSENTALKNLGMRPISTATLPLTSYGTYMF